VTVVSDGSGSPRLMRDSRSPDKIFKWFGRDGLAIVVSPLLSTTFAGGGWSLNGWNPLCANSFRFVTLGNYPG
jgi:hypothetical protein